MTNWEELHRLCMGCQRCALADTRTNVVFGKGPRDAKIMFIGEGPGENEDLQGEPFVGRGGQLLDEMLSLIGLSREQNFYITNIVKCRPPKNRDPLNTEQDACIGYLWDQMALLRPRIVVCLGRIAAMRLIKPQDHPGARPLAGEGRGVLHRHLPPCRPAPGPLQEAGHLCRPAGHPRENTGGLPGGL